MAFGGFSGPIDIILKKESFTLQELLDEDDVLVEVKKQKPELLAFLTKTPNLTQMVTYIVELPKGEVSEDVQNRYPVVCSEIFVCEDETLEKALFSSNQINRFFEFFSGSANVLLSSVVTKVLSTLLDTQPMEMCRRIKQNPKWITDMLQNLQCPSVAEFISKYAQESLERSGTQDFLESLNLADLLYGKLSKANVQEHSNTVTFVLHLLNSLTWESSLLQSFTNPKPVAILLQHIFEAGNDSGFKSGMQIITQLFSRMSVWMKEASSVDEEDDDPEVVKQTMEKPDLHGPLKSLPGIVQEVVKLFPKYPTLLQTPPTITKIQDQSGKTQEAFGFHRLYLLENVSALLELGFSAVVMKLIETDFLNVAWDLIFKFPHNPFCHRNVEKITSTALEMVGGESQIKILKATNLPGRLIKAETENKKNEEAKKPRKAYMPYLHKQGNMLQLTVAANENVATYLTSIGGWKEFSEALEAEKKKMDELMAARNLGGDDEANVFKPGQHYGDLDAESEAYTEGHDGDADDLSLADDVDMDSSNDFEDYDIDHAEVLLRKEEVEAFA